MPRLANISKYCRSCCSGSSAPLKRVQHAGAFHRRLLHAVDHGRFGQAGGFEDCGGDVDDVGELGAKATLLGDPPGQWTIVPLRVPPQCEATCLVHWNGVLVAHAQPTE